MGSSFKCRHKPARRARDRPSMNRKSPDWKPTSSLRILKKRAHMLRQTRRFFNDSNVLEAETPILARTGSTDPYLTNIRCRLATHSGVNFYLETSPEFAYLKISNSAPKILLISMAVFTLSMPQQRVCSDTEWPYHPGCQPEYHPREPHRA